MKISVLKLLTGEVLIPEGYSTCIAKRFQLSQPNSVWQYRTDTRFFLNIEYFRAAWGVSEVKNPMFNPEIFLQNDRGAKTYQPKPIPLIEISSPGATVSDLGKPSLVKANHSARFNLWYDPGSVIKISFSGYGTITGDEDPQFLDLAIFGRYYNKSQSRNQ